MAPGCRGGGEGVTCSISSCWVLSAEPFFCIVGSVYTDAYFH